MLKYFIIVAFLVSIFGGAYWYISNTNSKIEALLGENATLAANQETLKSSLNKNNETISEMEKDAIETRERYEKLEADFDLLRMYNAELPAKLERHDLNYLALKKPELVEKIINNATKDANRCLELLSGSPKNTKELAAKSESEFNSECPWLFE